MHILMVGSGFGSNHLTGTDTGSALWELDLWERAPLPVDEKCNHTVKWIVTMRTAPGASTCCDWAVWWPRGKVWMQLKKLQWHLQQRMDCWQLFRLYLPAKIVGCSRCASNLKEGSCSVWGMHLSIQYASNINKDRKLIYYFSSAHLTFSSLTVWFLVTPKHLQCSSWSWSGQSTTFKQKLSHETSHRISLQRWGSYEQIIFGHGSWNCNWYKGDVRPGR